MHLLCTYYRGAGKQELYLLCTYYVLTIVEQAAAARGRRDGGRFCRDRGAASGLPGPGRRLSAAAAAAAAHRGAGGEPLRQPSS